MRPPADAISNAHLLHLTHDLDRAAAAARGQSAVAMVAIQFAQSQYVLECLTT